MSYRESRALVVAVVSILLSAECLDMGSESQASQSPNGGIVQTMDTMGKSILGPGAFSARVFGSEGNGTLMLDFQVRGLTPDGVPDVIVNLFPSATCRTGARLVLNPSLAPTSSAILVFLDEGAYPSGPPNPEFVVFECNSSQGCGLTDPVPAEPAAKTGAVRALDQLGKTLLGKPAFSARLDAGSPSTLVLDIGTSSALSVVVSVMDRSSCSCLAQLIVDRNTPDGIRQYYNIFTDSYDTPDVQYVDLSGDLPQACEDLIGAN